MRKRILGLLRRIENRIFYAIFQTTRVTNDNYGWKPSPKDSKTGVGQKEEQNPKK